MNKLHNQLPPVNRNDSLYARLIAVFIAVITENKKKLVRVMLLALLFAAFAGGAWAEDKTVIISSEVTSQEQVTQAERNADVAASDTVSYEINGGYAVSDSGIQNGYPTTTTTIAIGTEYNTASISVSGYYAIYSGPSYMTPGDAVVTLNAESINISGDYAGIYSIAYVDSSTITLSAASNTITANDVAISSFGNSTVSITGATTLTASIGARTYRGGNVYFNDDVIANTPTVALADGSGSIINFNGGLSNEGYAEQEGASVIEALNDGTVTVNMNCTGTVNYTGTTTVDSSSVIDIYLTSGSTWYLTGDSTATSLAINSGGLLDMTADSGQFSTLTLGSLTGDGGTIQMDIDASTGTDSDRLLVGTHSDTHYITLNNVSVSDPTDSVIGTVLVSVGTENGEFKVSDTEGALYWNRYTLASQENTTDADYSTDWYIKEATIITDEDEESGDSGDVDYEDSTGTSGSGTPRETTTVNTVMSASSLNYHSWMMQNAKLLQRLGDLRQGANDGNNGAWFRISGSKLTMGGDHGFENKYMQYEAGYDKVVEQTSKYTMYGGIALTFTDGESAYNRGDGDNESKAVSLYFTQINKGGSYLDVVFKLGRWENDFTAYDTSYNRIEGKTENTGMSVSAELGKKFALGSRGLYIEPQAQLTYGYFDGDSYTVTRGNEQVNVHADGIHSLVGRAGFNLGWDINPRSNVYLKANVLHEFLGDYAVVMNDGINTPLSRTGDYSDTWFLYGLGASFKLGKANSGNFLHFDVERSTGGDLDQEWFYNVGFRFEM